MKPFKLMLLLKSVFMFISVEGEGEEIERYAPKIFPLKEFINHVITHISYIQ